jgi:hypothetical protein
MKTGFKDRTAPKEHKPTESPINGKNSPWDFRCPDYDERTSCFISAGTHYGTGHAQPTGHNGSATQGTAVPKGRVKTMKIDERG